MKRHLKVAIILPFIAFFDTNFHIGNDVFLLNIFEVELRTGYFLEKELQKVRGVHITFRVSF